MCLWTGFVCRGQYWLVYHLVLSVMDSYGWYSTWFCLSWIILVGISPFLSVVDKNGWYINRFSLSWK